MLDVNTGEVITLQEAQDYVSEFKKNYPDEVTSFFVGKNHIKDILNQEDCIGLRVYNGYDYAEARMNQVFIGVNSDENDMKGLIVNKTTVCPPICPIDGLMD
ncbi:hypothetical protein NAT51_19050 [Flavobacterium amniphilum]|uniref:hypothetical protein n=1 Tax=Flavobacterium amniphilum TaxID=1834035 RepID=UPI00202AA9F5|nr:hypothetical protein [Flavobacterium amniphilum]MCL9807628.1 hypothetical protein [Flavobacterium amniphilum]